MIKTTRTIFYRTVIIIAILALTVGCSEMDKTTDLATDTNIQPSECQTIRICLKGYTDTGEPRNLKSINEMLDELNERTEHEINTKIELSWLPYRSVDNLDYDMQLLELLKSDNSPDAFLLPNCGIEILSNAGLIMDITELFPIIAPGYYSMLIDTWGDEIDDSYKYNDRIYAIPNNEAISSKYCVIAREDLVMKYMPYGINSLDDYATFLISVEENEKNIISGSFNVDDFIWAYMMGNGYYSITSNVVGKWEDDCINPRLIYDTVEFIDACALYTKLKENVNLQVNLNAAVLDGKLASIFGRMWVLRDIIFTNEYYYQMYPLYWDNYSTRTRPSLSSMGISSNSNNADRVLAFIQWLHSSQENYDLFTYGIKDKHYKLSGKCIDFTGISNAITGWETVFKNYLLERPYPYEPENYLEFRKECVLKNMVTNAELFDMKGYDYKDYLKYIEECRYISYLHSLSEEFYNYLKMLDQGLEDKTLKQIINEKGLQDKADTVLEFFESYFLTK